MHASLLKIVNIPITTYGDVCASCCFIAKPLAWVQGLSGCVVCLDWEDEVAPLALLTLGLACIVSPLL